MEDSAPITRRTMLAGVAGGMAATSGCLAELQNLVGRQRHQQLSLSIATLPSDEDPYAMQIATELSENLSAVGIETRIDPMARDVLLREVLVNNDFDIYVARYPGLDDPDVLRSMLHSTYSEEAGWQNPFGFGDIRIDELLDEQRTIEGDERRETVEELQNEVLREQPFTVLAFPDDIAAIRSDRFVGWPSGGLRDSLSYLSLQSLDGTETLRLLTTDPRITHNRNPIAAEHRDRGIITGLLYESLVRGPEETIPWLAREIAWSTTGNLSATVTIRDVQWHDDEPLTTEDVAFTYRFLADTSLGEFETPVPTPWKRGRVSLVESAAVIDPRHIAFEFSTSVPDIAARAFTVPILPEHVWRERAEPADIAGIDIVGGTTEALVWPNEEPIGSGPLQFVDAQPDESLELERFDDHFLHGDAEGLPDEYVGGPTFERVQFQVVPSQDAAIELLENDDADATLGGLRENIVPRIGRAPALDLTVALSDSFYHVGYNCRRAPLTDPRFRRAVASLLDRETIVSDVFAGYASPANTPLSTTFWATSEKRWDGEGYPPFVGTRGDLDVEAAREKFRDAGYIYDDGELVRRGEP